MIDAKNDKLEAIALEMRRFFDEAKVEDSKMEVEKKNNIDGTRLVLQRKHLSTTIRGTIETPTKKLTFTLRNKEVE